MKALMMTIMVLIWGLLFTILFQSCSDNKRTPENYNTGVHKCQDSVYQPGIGEIMNNIIQPHHYKLWLAGSYRNWQLADYEITQLTGGFKRVTKFHAGSTAAAAVPMIYPALENIKMKIRYKDLSGFKNAFSALTKSCNGCHKVTRFDFVVVMMPTSPAFDNQQFLPAGSKQ